MIQYPVYRIVYSTLHTVHKVKYTVYRVIGEWVNSTLYAAQRELGKGKGYGEKGYREKRNGKRVWGIGKREKGDGKRVWGKR